MTKIEGFVAPGFDAVADEFQRNFDERGELGAAFAAYSDGELVVDLWGGMADAEAGRSWQHDTLQMIFSGTKGLVATCLLLLLDRGQLALDEPVATYWPEFAANGKGAITVGQIASHQARLGSLTAPTSPRDILDDHRMAAALEAQAPDADPRAGRAYHALTYGWLCGELVRRVTGRSVGRYLHEEVAEPLGLEAWIGLPEAHDHRVATLSYGPEWQPAAAAYAPEEVARDASLRALLSNPTIFPEDDLYWNDPAFRRAEIPAINGIANARSMAKLYGCLACGGQLQDLQLVTPAIIELGRRERVRFRDPFFFEPMAYGVGFQLQTELERFGTPADCFGHGGAGGSIHAAWPSLGVGFSYSMNQLRAEPVADPRSVELISALHAAVTRRG